MKTFPVPREIQDFSKAFTSHGYQLYIVGGSIRDYLLGIQNHDYDFTTDAKPREVMRLFRHVIPTGLEHGTVTVLFGDSQYEVTTFRTEGAYLDGRHPSHVDFVGSLAQDLQRRDFTINAFAADCQDGRIIDLHHGFEDLSKGLVRAIGEPRERFLEDGLRILRALRFASKLDFSIEEETFKAMGELKGNLSHVSKERIHDELSKLISSKHPAKGLLLADTSKILDVILPELARTRDIQQNGQHHDTVLVHCIHTCQVAADHEYPFFVREAALFHDIGKWETVVYHEDGNTYYRHEIVGEKLCAEILQGLKASNLEIDTVSHLIAMHMFHYTSDWSDAGVRRFIKRVGREHIDDVLRLHLCDVEATCGDEGVDTSTKAQLEVYASIGELEDRIKGILSQGDALSLKDLAVNGKDIMSLGVPQGPQVKATLEYLLECVMDDPKQNTKKQLTEIAKSHLESSKAATSSFS